MMEHQMQNWQGTTSETSSVQVIDSVASETVNGGVGEEDRDFDQVVKKNIVLERKVVVNVVELQKDVCVIDVCEKVCRICHLSSETVLMDLIQLGCGCKEDLGISHQHCAETWFKLKGNRCCEICGEAAKNVTGVGDDRFMEDWNERRLSSTDTTNIIPPSERRGFWHGQTFCNFLMVCLVVAFVLPWFFRVNAL